MEFYLPTLGCVISIFGICVVAVILLWRVCKRLCAGSVLARRVYMICLTPVVVIFAFKAQVVVGCWLIMLWAQGVDNMIYAGR